jgi:ketosteroid isomerase-like protein
MTSTVTFDLAALAHAIEHRDADAQLSYYHPDAAFTLVDHDNPPSAPRLVEGSAELRTYLADACDRDMTHTVRNAIHVENRIAFEVACAYPDGTRVLCMCIAGLTEGRIAWHHQVQAWDH